MILLKYLKNLTRHRSENNFIFECQNDYVKRLNIDDMIAKSNQLINILVTSSNILHKYFDGPNKIIFRSVCS